ncbi:MAG: S41 family peptidase [Deltaproteobacteria bacterium]|nr:S41 family peptidase [Deltaproteobacteria bacterium]
MISQKSKHIKLWFIVIVAVIFLTIGSGFYRNISASSDEAYESLKVFSDVIELIEQNYVDPVEANDLIQKAIQGMVQSLDPHSSLMPPDAFEDLKIDTRGKFTGIGIHITMRDGFVTVISPIEGTPAYKAGVQAMDKIIKVDGTITNDLRDAVDKMRGPKGTKVTITIIRGKSREEINLTLVRDVIPIESIKSFMLKPGYGYIRISNFTGSTTKDLIKNLEKIESDKTALKGLVLDLRNNGGGLLNQAIKVSDLFINDGIILSIKGRNEQNTKTFKAHSNKAKRDYPIVMLINGGSASASEIVAGALQDHKRALILGTTSFGKGSVQTVEPLRDGSALKLTTARYYTPSGKSIQAKGIKPDIVVKHGYEGSTIKDDHMLKEKDLRNHLDADPKKVKDKVKDATPEKPSKEDLKIKYQEYSIGKLDSDILKRDIQVSRALEILIGYETFKK